MENNKRKTIHRHTYDYRVWFGIRANNSTYASVFVQTKYQVSVVSISIECLECSLESFLLLAMCEYVTHMNNRFRSYDRVVLLLLLLLLTQAVLFSFTGPQDAQQITAILGDSVVFNCHVEFPTDHPVPYVLQWERKLMETVCSTQ